MLPLWILTLWILIGFIAMVISQSKAQLHIQVLPRVQTCLKLWYPQTLGS